MIFLEDLFKNRLTKGIRNLSPIINESNIVKNKLLDGSQHIQVIGEPTEYITLDVLADYDQTRRINIGKGTGEILRLNVYNETYEGAILEDIYWERFGDHNKNKNNINYIATIRFDIIRGLENEEYQHNPSK